SFSAHFSNTAMGWKSPRPMALVSRRWSKPSSAISGPHGSTDAQSCRPVTRWRACSMLGSQTRQPEGKPSVGDVEIHALECIARLLRPDAILLHRDLVDLDVVDFELAGLLVHPEIDVVILVLASGLPEV